MSTTTVLRAFIFMGIATFSLHATSYDAVLTGFNERIQFDKITPDYIDQTKKQAMKELTANLEKIYKIPASKRTFENTVRAFDSSYGDFGKIYGMIYLMNVAHPDEKTRSSANEAVIEFGKFDNELSLNEDLYRSFKEYPKSSEAKSLKGFKEKYLRETIRDFENAMVLPFQKKTVQNLKKLMTGFPCSPICLVKILRITKMNSL
jgi:oligopeptidase A